jgi:uncharacterized membrane protein (DUF2068 family)
MRSRSLLPWIIAFKAFKAIALTALGIALLVTRHADPVDVLLGVASTIHLPVTSRLFQRLLLLVADLSISKETAVALTAFAYAILMGTEGVALYLRRPWARWFTIVATSSLIPLEVYEIVREVHPMRVFILLANIAVVVYLWRRKDVFE